MKKTIINLGLAVSMIFIFGCKGGGNSSSSSSDCTELGDLEEFTNEYVEMVEKLSSGDMSVMNEMQSFYEKSLSMEQKYANKTEEELGAACYAKYKELEAQLMDAAKKLQESTQDISDFETEGDGIDNGEADVIEDVEETDNASDANNNASDNDMNVQDLKEKIKKQEKSSSETSSDEKKEQNSGTEDMRNNSKDIMKNLKNK